MKHRQILLGNGWSKNSPILCRSAKCIHDSADIGAILSVADDVILSWYWMILKNGYTAARTG